MSRENVELVRRIYANANVRYYSRIDELHRAHETGDFSALLADLEPIYDENFVLKPPENSPFPDSGGERRGREGLLRFVAAQTESFDKMFIEPEEFIDAGEQVVVPLRFGGRARHTGIEVIFPVVHVVSVRDGVLTRLDIFSTRAEALGALGLSPPA